MKRTVLIALALIVVVIAASTLAWVVTDRDDNRGSEEAKPLLVTASTFPVPAGSVVAMPDTTTKEPPTAVRGWKASGTLTEACNRWREGYRSWMGENQFGQVTGEVVENQSCTLEGRKDGYNARLLVAIYGTEPPQVTLTVTK